MPIAKSNGLVTQTAPAPVSSAATASISATEKKVLDDTHPGRSNGRDYDAEARGKVACASFAAALASPGIAGLGYTNYDQLMAEVRKAAEEMVKFTWQKQNEEK